MSAALSELVVAPSLLRALPIPDTEPEADHEPYARPRWSRPDDHRQPTLALALVTVPDPAPIRMPGDDFGPRPTATTELPEPREWAARLVQAVIEVLSGVRPLPQLLRWTTPEVYAGLQRRCRGSVARQSSQTAKLAAKASTTGLTASGVRRSVVRSVHIGLPADGVVEACAVVIARGRAQAVALRLEGLDGRWRMTALEIG